MKENKEKENKNKEKESNEKERLWYSSPLVLGVKSLIPVVLVLSVLGLAIKSTQSSKKRVLMRAGERVASPLAHQELAKQAALHNDYQLAQTEYEKGRQLLAKESAVLGWQAELEEVVWPEKALKKRINLWLEELKDRASRELYLKVALGYWKLRQDGKALEYWEKAKNLDPNDSQVREVEKLVK